MPAIEQQIFEQASYGKQLGWLMDVLLDAVDPATLRSPAAQASLLNLKKLDAKVERIKREHRQERVDAAIALLDQLQTDSPQELARVLQRYQTRGALCSPAADPTLEPPVETRRPREANPTVRSSVAR